MPRWSFLSPYEVTQPAPGASLSHERFGAGMISWQTLNREKRGPFISPEPARTRRKEFEEYEQEQEKRKKSRFYDCRADCGCDRDWLVGCDCRWRLQQGGERCQ